MDPRQSPVIAVNDVDQIVCSLVVVTSQMKFSVLPCLIIETDCRDAGHHIAMFWTRTSPLQRPQPLPSSVLLDAFKQTLTSDKNVCQMPKNSFVVFILRTWLRPSPYLGCNPSCTKILAVCCRGRVVCTRVRSDNCSSSPTRSANSSIISGTTQSMWHPRGFGAHVGKQPSAHKLLNSSCTQTFLMQHQTDAIDGPHEACLNPRLTQTNNRNNMYIHLMM